MKFMQTVLMSIIIQYALCFRMGESLLDRVRGLLNSWKDVADFENLLGNFNYKDTLLGLFLHLNKYYISPPKKQSIVVRNQQSRGIFVSYL